MALTDTQENDQRECFTRALVEARDEFTEGEETEDFYYQQEAPVHYDEPNLAIMPCPLEIEYNIKTTPYINAKIQGIDANVYACKTKFNLFTRDNLSILVLNWALPYKLSNKGIARFNNAFTQIRNNKCSYLQTFIQGTVHEIANVFLWMFNQKCHFMVTDSTVQLKIVIHDNERTVPKTAHMMMAFRAAQFQLFFDWISWMTLGYRLPYEADEPKKISTILKEANRFLQSLLASPSGFYYLSHYMPQRMCTEREIFIGKNAGVVCITKEQINEDINLYACSTRELYIGKTNEGLCLVKELIIPQTNPAWVTFHIANELLPKKFPKNDDNIKLVLPFVSELLMLTTAHGDSIHCNPFQAYLEKNQLLKTHMRDYLLPPFNQTLHRELGLKPSRVGLYKTPVHHSGIAHVIPSTALNLLN